MSDTHHNIEVEAVMLKTSIGVTEILISFNHSLGYSADDSGDIFLLFLRKQVLTVHAN